MSLCGLKKKPLPHPARIEERRRLPDRRKRATPLFSRYTFIGRRSAVRRYSDRKRFVYVDRYSFRLFVLMLSIILLGVADAFFTLYHVHVHNAVEVNPIMNYFLGKSSKIFFNVKYILTAICLMVLCVHKNLPVVRVLLVVVFSIYVLILFNHVYLFLMVS